MERVRVTPTNRHAKGTITVNGQTVASGAASGDIALSEGENVITVQITAPDNYTSRTYTVRVVRASAAASADATLRGLAVYTATGKQPDAANQVGLRRGGLHPDAGADGGGVRVSGAGGRTRWCGRPGRRRSTCT